MIITSLQNHRVKQAVKLRRRAGRDEQGRFLVDGVREIQQALLSGITVVQGFACPSLIALETRDTLAAVSARAEVHEVTSAVWDKLAYGQRRDGLLIIAQHEHRDLGALESEIRPPLPIVVLDQLEKPGNAGAIFRTAAAAGVSAIIASNPKTDLCNPNAIRASLGTIFRVPWITADTAEVMRWLKQRQIPVIVADAREGRAHFDVPLAQTCALVLGSEAHGVSSLWNDPSFARVRIPMRQDVVDSLNVATSAAILLYEALRQRAC